MRNSSILKNSVTLISGTAIGQGVFILFQLLIRRMYSVEEFGAYAVYMSFAGVIILLSTLRYELSIVLPKEERKAGSIVIGGIIISLLINSFVFIIILIFKDSICSILSFPEEYSYWLYFLPLSTLLYSVYQLFNYWLTRQTAYKSISINKVTRRFFEGSTQSILGHISYSTGLIIGDIIGGIANVLSGIYQISKRGFTVKNISFLKIKSSLKRYRNFPKHQLFPVVINHIGIIIPIVLINKFFSSDDAGFFDLSKQILSVPLALVTASLSQVLLKDFSIRIKERKTLLQRNLRTAFVLLLIILPVNLVLFLFGKELFGFVFSSIWETSGYYAAILVPAFSFKFIVNPLDSNFIALEKLKVFAFWQIGHFLLLLSLFYFKDYSIEFFLIYYVVIEFVAYSIKFLMIVKLCRDYDKTIN